MTRTPHRTLLSCTGAAVVAVLAVAVVGCGQGAPTAAVAPSAAPPTGSDRPAPPDVLVLRVEDVGGFTTASTALARLPAVSVYADGRVITQVSLTPPPEGPPPALPSLVVQDVGPEGAAQLVSLARDAGVGTDALLGRPGIADATTTRFTVVIDGAEATTEAYALRESASDAGQEAGESGPDAGFAPGDGFSSTLTTAQQDARQQLVDLRDALVDVGAALDGDAGPAAPYQPSALAVLAVPLAPGTAGDQQPTPWPGPALPGEPAGAPDATCVVAQGAALGRALTAADGADVTAPWSSGGSSWTLTFRPLLPDERGCADLGG